MFVTDFKLADVPNILETYSDRIEFSQEGDVIISAKLNLALVTFRYTKKNSHEEFCLSPGGIKKVYTAWAGSPCEVFVEDERRAYFDAMTQSEINSLKHLFTSIISKLNKIAGLPDSYFSYYT